MDLTRKHQPAIDWATVGQPVFDRIVEALVTRLYDGAWDVRTIDGKGGDGGEDIECVHCVSGERHVFQLKYFPEGFSGPFGKRRDQIKRSFTKLDPIPDKWLLVAPCATNKSGYTFLGNLVGTSTKFSFWHRGRLDELFAQHPDLVSFFQRSDQVLENARILGQEKAVLAGGAADLVERVSALQALVGTTDPNWTLDFATEGERITRTLRAKHARAAEQSPISIQFSVDPSGLSDADRAIMHDLDYGLAGSVTFPAELVTDYAVDGPDLVRQEPTDGVEVTVVQPPNPNVVGKRVQLHVHGHGHTHVFHGALMDGRPARPGFSLQAVFEEIVTITILMPRSKGQHASRNMSAAGTFRIELGYPNSPRVEQVQVVSELMIRLADADRVELRAGARHLATFGLDGAAGMDRDVFVDQKDLADDLLVVQGAARNRFPMPTEVSDDDRLFARALRLALERGRTYAPGVVGVRGTFTPDAIGDPALRSFFAGEDGAIFVRQDPFEAELFGHTLYLPEMGFYHPAVRLINHAEVRSQLERGQQAAFDVRADDGSLMHLIGPAHQSNESSPQPWGLRGIPEAQPRPGTGEDQSGSSQCRV